MLKATQRFARTAAHNNNFVAALDLERLRELPHTLAVKANNAASLLLYLFIRQNLDAIALRCVAVDQLAEKLDARLCQIGHSDMLPQPAFVAAAGFVIFCRRNFSAHWSVQKVFAHRFVKVLRIICAAAWQRAPHTNYR